MFSTAAWHGPPPHTTIAVTITTSAVTRVLPRQAMGNSPSTPTKQAEQIIEASLSNPITIFSKRSCAYCHHAKKLITDESVTLSNTGCHIPKPVVIELDDGTIPPETVSEILRLLKLRTGAATVPRVFVDGNSIGGAVETARLASHGGLKVALATAARCPP